MSPPDGPGTPVTLSIQMVATMSVSSERVTLDHGRRLPRGSRRGSLFVFATVSLMFLLILGLTSIQVAQTGYVQARIARNSTQSIDLAEAAADSAESYLRSLTSPPTFSATGGHQSYPLDGTTINLTYGSCKAVMYYDPGNINTWQKVYVIDATGTTTTGNVTRHVIARIRQQSFALYSYFTDQEKSSIDNSTIYFFSRDAVHGPVHSNDQIHISWDRTDTTPIFYGTVSSANSSISWSGSGTPSGASDWTHISQGGQASFTLGVDAISLPANTNGQQYAAWGATSGFPTTAGSYLPLSTGTATSGIYVVGDCTVAFSVDASGNQVITVVANSKTYVYTMNLTAQTTTVKVGTAAATTYSGLPNGMLYTSGNITSISGTLADNLVSGTSVIRRNSWTVATDVLNGKDITITNNLSYATLPDDTLPDTDTHNTHAATLGLVGDQIKLDTSCPSNETITAAMLCGCSSTTTGTFYNTTYNSSLKNTLTVIGGITQKKRGPIGTLNGNTLTEGYAKNYVYDSRMMDNPPPCFPMTPQYDLISWQYK